MIMHGKIRCKKCGKIFSLFNYNPKEDVYVKCCNKKIKINSEEVTRIQNFDYKCPECNKKVECFYIDRKCPNCGEINTEENCWRKPEGKPEFKGFSSIRY